MVQNLRDYLVTIKWTARVQEKIELSSISQRPKLSSSKVSGNLSLATKIRQK